MTNDILDIYNFHVILKARVLTDKLVTDVNCPPVGVIPL